jgi:hypothetical protein
MDRVEEIEAVIDTLASAEFRPIAHWFRDRDQANGDGQMDADCLSHKLDFLFEEADDQTKHAQLRDWPRMQ